MKNRSKEWIKASEDYVDSNVSNNSEPVNEVNKYQDCEKLEVNNAYIKLTKCSLSEMENKCSPSLLLPAIVQPSKQITVHIQSGGNEIEKLVFKECIENLVDKRNVAIKTVRYLRNEW